MPVAETELLMRLPAIQVPNIHMIELHLVGQEPMLFNMSEAEFHWSNTTLVPTTSIVAASDPSKSTARSNVGPPRTFFGRDVLPTDGVLEARKRDIDPNTGVNKVLIINAYTTDHTPGSTNWNNLGGKASANDERTRQRQTFDVMVKGIVKQMSHDRLKFDFTVTKFYALPENDDHYFFREADVIRAQAAFDADMSDENKEALETAKRRGATAQRAGDLFYDAIKAAKADYNVDQYDGIYVQVLGPFLRCASHGRFGSIQEDRSEFF